MPCTKCPSAILLARRRTAYLLTRSAYRIDERKLSARRKPLPRLSTGIETGLSRCGARLSGTRNVAGRVLNGDPVRDTRAEMRRRHFRNAEPRSRRWLRVRCWNRCIARSAVLINEDTKLGCGGPHLDGVDRDRACRHVPESKPKRRKRISSTRLIKILTVVAPANRIGRRVFFREGLCRRARRDEDNRAKRCKQSHRKTFTGR